LLLFSRNVVTKVHFSGFGYFLLKDIIDFIDGRLIEDGHDKWSANLSRVLQRQVGLFPYSPPWDSCPLGALSLMACGQVAALQDRSKKVREGRKGSSLSQLTLLRPTAVNERTKNTVNTATSVFICTSRGAQSAGSLTANMVIQDLPVELIVQHLCMIEFSIYQSIKVNNTLSSFLLPFYELFFPLRHSLSSSSINRGINPSYNTGVQRPPLFCFDMGSFLQFC